MPKLAEIIITDQGVFVRQYAQPPESHTLEEFWGPDRAERLLELLRCPEWQAVTLPMPVDPDVAWSAPAEPNDPGDEEAQYWERPRCGITGNVGKDLVGVRCELPEGHDVTVVDGFEHGHAVHYGGVWCPLEVPATATAENVQPSIPAEPEDDSLPEGFPGLAALAEADITTYEGVRNAGDLTLIAHIGDATRDKIIAALEAHDADEGDE